MARRHQRLAVGAVRVPELAVDEHEPVAADDAVLADEVVHADLHGPAAYLDSFATTSA